MDIDRRRAEAAEYKRKPRLIEENEVPSSITEQSKRFTADDEENAANLLLQQQQGTTNNTPCSSSSLNQFADVGRRKRKDINYSQVGITSCILI